MERSVAPRKLRAHSTGFLVKRRLSVLDAAISIFILTIGIVIFFKIVRTCQASKLPQTTLEELPVPGSAPVAVTASPKLAQLRNPTSNPSAWSERLPLLGLALCGLVVACALAAFQTGCATSIWDPFFGSASSKAVVQTSVLRFLPLPDAVLGIFGYLADLVFGGTGGEKRWRTRPWLVLLFGSTILSLALVSIALLVLQAFVVRQWCTLCLLSAAISLVICILGISEPWASLRYLHQVCRAGGSWWQAMLTIEEYPNAVTRAYEQSEGGSHGAPHDA